MHGSNALKQIKHACLYVCLIVWCNAPVAFAACCTGNNDKKSMIHCFIGA